MKVDVLLGLQWGDEGKGKIVDVLTPEYDIIARFQGGPNAGHTIEFDDKKFILHTIPSGIFNEKTINIIGNGVIIDAYIFNKELINLKNNNIDAEKNLLISKKAHLILPTHRLLDATYENAKGKSKIGSTLKGIGPAYTDKTARDGIRIGNINNPDFKKNYNNLKQKHLQIIDFYKFDYTEYLIDGLLFSEYEEKWFEAIEKIRTLKTIDSEYFINQSLKNNKSILAEGAQGTLLDVDFGSYPFVTSSNTITAGVCIGLGVAPNRIGNVFGVFKAYCTRVGSGPFPTELSDETGEKLRDKGNEFGSTTGRPRRCGWLDITALKYSIMLNGVTSLIMTKADVLNHFENINISTKYKYNNDIIDYIPFELPDEKLNPDYNILKGWNTSIDNITSFDNIPAELSDYINFIEHQVGIPIKIISVGPDRKQIIRK
ncbi:MAG: adenylosuccinate synthase [Bacteroidales bacterium]|nr:adenylosuccinate synthase [Bacteroidales bacterium]